MSRRSASPDRSIDVIDSAQKWPSDCMVTALPAEVSTLCTTGSLALHQSKHARMELAVLRDALPFVGALTRVVEDQLVSGFELA